VRIPPSTASKADYQDDENVGWRDLLVISDHHRFLEHFVKTAAKASWG
jgi:hypothetical protein